MARLSRTAWNGSVFFNIEVPVVLVKTFGLGCNWLEHHFLNLSSTCSATTLTCSVAMLVNSLLDSPRSAVSYLSVKLH